MRAQQIGDGLGASKSGRAARWQLGVWWKGLSEPDRAAVWWWLGTFGVSVLTILGLGTHSGTGLKLYESQSSMIVGLSVGWLALAVISFATISATLARFSWKRWRREGRQGLWRILWGETGRPVVFAWIGTIFIFGVVVWIISGYVPGGLPTRGSSGWEIVGVTVDRLALAIGAIATAIAALVYHVQKRNDEVASLALQEGIHREEQFRLWSESLKERMEGPATWRVLGDLAKRDSNLSDSILRVAQHSIDQYAFEVCVKKECTTRRGVTEPCDRHPMQSRIGKDPAACLVEVLRLGHGTSGIDHDRPVELGRQGVEILRDLNLGSLPAASSPRVDLSALRPGVTTPLTLAVHGSAGSGEALAASGTILPRAVPTGAVLTCEVRRGSGVHWGPPMDLDHVEIAGTVRLTVGNPGSGSLTTECVLRKWTLTGTLELSVFSGARVRFEDCSFAGGTIVLDSSRLHDVKIEATYGSSEADANHAVLGTLKTPGVLELTASTIDLGSGVGAPVLESNMAPFIDASDNSTISLLLAEDQSVPGVAIGPDSNVLLVAKGSLSLETVDAKRDKSDGPVIRPEAGRLLDVKLSGVRGMDREAQNGIRLELMQISAPHTWVKVEFSEGSSYTLAVNPIGVAKLEASIEVSTVGQVGEVALVANDDDESAKVMGILPTVLNRIG